jgi:tRNA(Arg) A34 adenosine deaminase TadA
MALAIAEAAKGDARPGAGEVGCVIVCNGEVVAAGYNEAELRHDPTAHAEIVTMRKLGQQLKSTDFRGCTLYCTLQPCSMCTVACIWGKITRIVFGAGRNDVHSMYFDTRHINSVDHGRLSGRSRHRRWNPRREVHSLLLCAAGFAASRRARQCLTMPAHALHDTA